MPDIVQIHIVIEERSTNDCYRCADEILDLISAEADRYRAVVDWLGENNPTALDLCPYKVKP